MGFEDYQYLEFSRPRDGVLQIVINRPDHFNALNIRMHQELTGVWRDVEEDPACRVAVITGAGRAFCAGGDLQEMILDQAKDVEKIKVIAKEGTDLVYNMINCEKPIISAINGPAAGAGLAAALLADISVIAENAKLTDGHLRVGVAAGDHAAIIWPLLCGMAKAKYFLMTADFVDGVEAERIGLVSKCRPVDEVLPMALEIAEKLAAGPQYALRYTKRAMNHWLRNAGPIFEASLGFELVNFFDDDVMEGATALHEKRAPKFPSTSS